MLWVDLLFVLVFALLLGALLSWGFGWRHPARSDAAGASFLFLFLVLLFAMWGGGVWMQPMGPVVYGTSWLGFLLIGALVALLLLAIAVPVRRVPPAEPPPPPPEAEAEEAVAVGAIFGIFFWVLLIVLLVSAIVGYFA